MRLKDIREEVHQNYLKSRALDTLLQQDIFDEYVKNSTEDEWRLLKEHVKASNITAIHKWMDNHSSLDLTERPITLLREIGRNLRVTNYSRITKLELIRAITRAREKIKNEKARNAGSTS